MDATLLVQYKPSLHLPDTLFSTFRLFPSFLLKINAFPMWYEIWKARKKMFSKRWIQTQVDRVKKYLFHCKILLLFKKYYS